MGVLCAGNNRQTLILGPYRLRVNGGRHNRHIRSSNGQPRGSSESRTYSGRTSVDLGQVVRTRPEPSAHQSGPRPALPCLAGQIPSRTTTGAPVKKYCLSAQGRTTTLPRHTTAPEGGVTWYPEFEMTGVDDVGKPKFRLGNNTGRFPILEHPSCINALKEGKRSNKIFQKLSSSENSPLGSRSLTQQACVIVAAKFSDGARVVWFAVTRWQLVDLGKHGPNRQDGPQSNLPDLPSRRLPRVRPESPHPSLLVVIDARLCDGILHLSDQTRSFHRGAFTVKSQDLFIKKKLLFRAIHQLSQDAWMPPLFLYQTASEWPCPAGGVLIGQLMDKPREPGLEKGQARCI